MAIQFDGDMSLSEASALAASPLYNPQCCDFCSDVLRLLREYYMNAAAADVIGPAFSNHPGPHPGARIDRPDREHILTHAVEDEAKRLHDIKNKLAW